MKKPDFKDLVYHQRYFLPVYYTFRVYKGNPLVNEPKGPVKQLGELELEEYTFVIDNCNSFRFSIDKRTFDLLIKDCNIQDADWKDIYFVVDCISEKENMWMCPAGICGWVPEEYSDEEDEWDDDEDEEEVEEEDEEEKEDERLGKNSKHPENFIEDEDGTKLNASGGRVYFEVDLGYEEE